MTTEWAHLPNAVHIDRVLASLKANPDKWEAAWNATWDAARSAARDAVWDAARDAVWDAARWSARSAARDAVWDAVWRAARDEAYGAILALIAYDDCAYMLESDPGELAIFAKFGDPKAILLLPACKVFHSLKVIA